jgi:hypothetical protein
MSIALAQLKVSPLIIGARVALRLWERLRAPEVPSEDFTFDGQAYAYHHHVYNKTWRNERAVEVPIGRAFVADCPLDQWLEVGNVLSHYGAAPHTVVDLYEKAHPWVINEDICTFDRGQRYARILCLSTLEHVGNWQQALRQMRHLLTPTGRALITFPLGEDATLDAAAQGGLPEVDRLSWMSRNPGNVWATCPPPRQQVSYNRYLPTANYIGVAELHGP